MQTPSRDQTASRTRIDYLDWLRGLAVLGVFVYHSLQPFSTHDWHVKNSQLSPGIDAVVSFVDPWGVAFFFLIAGAGSFLALRYRTPGQYVTERLTRLLLPFIVAYLLQSPIQAFIEERFFGRYTGSFIAGVPLFFQDVAARLPSTLLHPLLVDRTYHLWFVVFLLWFSLLGLPLFMLMRAAGWQGRPAWLARLADRRGMILMGSLLIAILPLVVLPLFPDSEDWGTFVYLFGFFVAGYVLMSEARLIEAVSRDVLISLAVAILVDGAMLLTGVTQFIGSWQDAPSYSWMYVWSYLLVVVQAWAWVNVLLGVGMRTRWFRRSLPRSVSAATMPFFLVHQPVILGITFFVVQWDAGIPLKWAMIALPSFVASAALATAIARMPVISMMFGVKARGRATAHRPAPYRVTPSTI